MISFRFTCSTEKLILWRVPLGCTLQREKQEEERARQLRAAARRKEQEDAEKARKAALLKEKIERDRAQQKPSLLTKVSKSSKLSGHAIADTVIPVCK